MSRNFERNDREKDKDLDFIKWPFYHVFLGGAY